MAKNLGWVKLHRTLAYNKLWLSEPFTKGQAWADLLMLAGRGGVVKASYQWLADRWHWCKAKAYRFIMWLKSEGMVEFSETQSETVSETASETAFRLINWEKYQHRETASETRSETRNETISGNLLISSNKNTNTRNIKQEPLKPPKRRSRFLSVQGEKSHELGDTSWMEVLNNEEDENEKDLL